MSELRPVEILELLESLQRRAPRDKRHHEVMLASMLAYLLYRESKNQVFEKASLIYMRTAIDSLLNEFDDRQEPSDAIKHGCSFCRRSQPEVRLAAGASGFICDACVATLGEVFGGKNDK